MGLQPYAPRWVSDSGDITCCPNCGAKRDVDDTRCRYCDHVFDDDLAAVVIPCWSCKELYGWEVARCSRCDVALWVPCLNCSLDVPHHVKTCIHCAAAL